jgi:hypothetical protein
MPVSDDASSGFGMPDGAAMAGDRPAPASDMASASRKSDDFNISGSPSNEPTISLLLFAIGTFGRRANG